MMPGSELVDQVARDAIENDLDRTLFVEAGAGTGKTHSLIQRAVRLIATGRATASSLAAITFTEAAAGELRDRLRATLEELAGDPARDAVERQRCDDALADMDAAAVETIHAFCRRLLVAYPLEAGLPPGFDLTTDTEAEAVFRAQWDAWFADYLERAADDDNVGRPLLRVFALGAKPRELYEIAATLREHWERLAPSADRVPQAELNVAGLVRRIREVCALVHRCIDEGDNMAKHLGSLALSAEALAAAPNEFAGLPALEQVAFRINGNRQKEPYGNFTRTGSGTNWPGGTLPGVREEVAALHADALAMHQSVAQTALAEVTREISHFVLAAAEERRRSGQLEFQDLLVLARNLLASRSDVREAVRARYTHLFIDEFQDTDPLQAEIAFLIGTSTPGVIEGDPLTLPLEPGRVFFVGDPKQSIYRFRRADIDIYRRVQAAFESSTVRLTQNFRSVPGVIDWVNLEFARRFDGISPHQARHIDLRAHRPPLTDGPAAYRIGAQRDGNVGDARTEEAQSIIALLRQVEAGEWLVGDGDSGTRPARLDDVAILSPSRPAARDLIDALEEHGVPHRLESRTLVYDAQEVRDLITILRALDDPTDQVALVAALRSPAFACGDDDLLRYYAAGGRWDFRQNPPRELPSDDPVVAGMAWLRREHDRRWWIPLTQVVDDVIEERRLFALAFVDRRPRERWQRLRYIAEQARAYAEQPDATLRGLIDWLEQQAEDRRQVLERVVPEPDDHAVRVMTMHAAKGLEFPIVILVGLNRTKSSNSPRVVWSANGTPEVRVNSTLQTEGYPDAVAADRLLDDLEDDRLLYVAMTRAEDHLVLSCYRGNRRGTAAEAIELRAREHPELCPDITPELLDGGDAVPAVTGRTSEATAEPLDRDAWLHQRRALLDSHRRRHAVSATALAHEHVLTPVAEADPGLEKDPPADEAPPWRRGRAGTSLGRAVHSVLQTVDLATGADLEAIAAAQATAEGVPDRVADVVRLARAALDSSAVREATSAGRYWREVYVASEIDGVIVDGFIDLLYETSEGFVVVDYKTDAIRGDNLDDMLERYRPQGLAYALVLSRQLQRPVLRCDFAFVSAPGGAAVRTIEVSPEALEELRSVVAR